MMYAEYLKEREDLSTIENEHGFLNYKITDKECFLAHIFVKKESRSSSAYPEFIDELVDIALLSGCKAITANIHTNDKGCTRNVKAGIKMGFQIKGAHNGALLLVKELGE